jgi:hypothetical protein
MIYFGVTGSVNHDVLRFQISVNETQIVQIFESQDDLGGVKPGMRLSGKFPRGIKPQ